MKEIKYVKLRDIYIIKNKKGGFQICINGQARSIKEKNHPIESKLLKIKMSPSEIKKNNYILLSEVLLGSNMDYETAMLQDSKIEFNVLCEWQREISNANNQKILENIFSTKTSEKQKNSLKEEISKILLKSLLKGYSLFTEAHFEEK